MIDNNVCKKLREEFNEALKEVAKKYGFKIETGNMKYDDSTIKVNVLVTDLSGLNNSMLPEAEDYIRLCSTCGGKLKPEWLGKEFYIRGEKFKLIGWNYYARKYKAVIEKNEVRYGYTMDALIDLVRQGGLS